MQSNIYNVIQSLDPQDVLTPSDKHHLAKTLEHFLMASISKYIKGKQEHGGDLMDCNFDKEIDQELLDLIIYRWHQKLKKGEILT